MLVLCPQWVEEGWREDKTYPSWKLARRPKAARVKDFILMLELWCGGR